MKIFQGIKYIVIIKLQYITNSIYYSFYLFYTEIKPCIFFAEALYIRVQGVLGMVNVWLPWNTSVAKHQYLTTTAQGIFCNICILFQKCVWKW